MEPPKEFLGAIGFKNIWMKMVFPALDFDTQNPRGWDFFVAFILGGLLNFFRIWERGGKERFCRIRQFLGNVFIEAITNVARHGNRFRGDIEVGWWLGEYGAVCGVRDQGKFFHDSANIALVESRVILEHTGEHGCGGGMESIYQGDGIKIIGGVLYLMVLKTTMEAWTGYSKKG